MGGEPSGGCGGDWEAGPEQAASKSWKVNVGPNAMGTLCCREKANEREEEEGRAQDSRAGLRLAPYRARAGEGSAEVATLEPAQRREP